MSPEHIQLTSHNCFVAQSVTDLHRTLKIGRRASRTACDAERRTIVGMLLMCFSTMMALTTQSAT
ncbi:DUF1534 domain-containing protein [Pseudomonas syringae pv. maculicola str. ES4326]|uniref:DUF1534 domain-containing protein n=1 Tax=Pseudomonas syringae pv. maculicola str. ES4326 TaxID=629265 RepID=A0A8T8C2F9_PSEYM|nr:DUF1534 domain-containing protein [Pseudomonas syringae pv. maculicola str. ES4326]